jgi:hypothetical protein
MRVSWILMPGYLDFGPIPSHDSRYTDGQMCPHARSGIRQSSPRIWVRGDHDDAIGELATRCSGQNPRDYRPFTSD